MRIGIDARLLSENITGIGRYTTELTKELVCKPNEFYLYSSRPIIDEQWQQDNVTVKTANFNSRVSKMLWSQTYLSYWAARDDLDVFWGPTHRLPRYLPKTTARVVTIHDLVWKHASKTMRPLSRWVERMLMPEAIRQADRIVADSISTANAIEMEYPTVGDKVRVVYPGTTEFSEPLNFQSLATLGIEFPYFLFVGTLEPRKNLQRLLRAYAMLSEETKNSSRLVIAGGKGWGGFDITSLVRDMKLNDWVILTGYVNEIQLATLYAHARFLVMPSLYEGFGLPLVEAMSFGIPVLTSNNSSLPEVAGDAGILVDPLDVNSIAEGIFSLIWDDTYRDQLASKAILNAKRFSWKNAAREIWSVLNEAVEVRAGRLQSGDRF